MTDAPLADHRETVRKEWIDYNGHMNVAYYLVIFDHATDVLLDRLGLGERYSETANAGTFAMEAHVTYQRELLLDSPVIVETQLLDFDHKRFHYFHRMRHETEGYLAATLEQISIHVDHDTRRSAAMPDTAQGALEKMKAAHSALETPPEVGSRIGIRR